MNQNKSPRINLLLKIVFTKNNFFPFCAGGKKCYKLVCFNQSNVANNVANSLDNRPEIFRFSIEIKIEWNRFKWYWRKLNVWVVYYKVIASRRPMCIADLSGFWMITDNGKTVMVGFLKELGVFFLVVQLSQIWQVVRRLSDKNSYRICLRCYRYCQRTLRKYSDVFR